MSWLPPINLMFAQFALSAGPGTWSVLPPGKFCPLGFDMQQNSEAQAGIGSSETHIGAGPGRRIPPPMIPPAIYSRARPLGWLVLT